VRGANSHITAHNGRQPQWTHLVFWLIIITPLPPHMHAYNTALINSSLTHTEHPPTHCPPPKTPPPPDTPTCHGSCYAVCC